nr:EOG090X05T8 [Leptodora kindtii]
MCSLLVAVNELFQLNGRFSRFRMRDNRQTITRNGALTVARDIKHLKLLRLHFLSAPDSIVQSTTTPVLSTQTSKAPVRSAVPEDEADVLLQKMDGMIPRKKDIKLCQHVGDNSSCIHCLPLEPYDPTYLEQHNIKHMSFHSYLRKMSSGYGSGKFADLDNISCRIKADCTAHPPWPRGVCSKCQPKAITLNRQVYRHVDNVMFENPNLVERFLHYWRVTGRQRVGLLYGRYEVHLDVPLGIKAVVSAIYEPPQESTRDSVQLLDDPNGELVKSISSKLGMSEIGWMFTDLVAEDAAKGTVRHFRHAATHFLSAQECIMAGHFQSTHPNACRNSSSGYMGSKFVTICVTGDSQHQVHMEGYQVSNQCEALVRDGCLVPTKDAPELGFIRQSSAQMYVPDVFYKIENIFFFVYLFNCDSKVAVGRFSCGVRNFIGRLIRF